MFTINGQLTPDDLIAAQQLHWKSEGWARLLPIFVAIIMVLSGLLMLFLFPAFGSAIWPLIAVFFFLIAIFPVNKHILFPRQIRRIYQQSDVYSSPQEIDIDETAIKITNKAGCTERQWADYLKWKSDTHYILLYYTEMLYTILPTRFLDGVEQKEFVLMQLSEHQVPKANTLKQIIISYIFLLISCLVLLGFLITMLR